MKILVTGVAGFIGYFTVQRLLARGDEVIGVDSVNNYYDTSIKEARISRLEEKAKATNGTFSFYRQNLADQDCLLYTSPSPRDRQKSRMPSSA